MEKSEVMAPYDIKTCRIVPKKYNYIPDLLLQNRRIEEETTMNLNKAEVWRAMMLADVYATVDGEETLMTPLNYMYKGDVLEIDDGEEEEEPDIPAEDDSSDDDVTSGDDESKTSESATPPVSTYNFGSSTTGDSKDVY